MVTAPTRVPVWDTHDPAYLEKATMTSHDPRRLCASTPAAIDRLAVRTPADLAGAIAALAAALGQATTARDSAPGLVAQAERQFAKALEQAHAAPVDKTALLVHLVAARAFLGEGQVPAALTGAVGGIIAQVHALAGASPAAFC